MPSTRSKAFPHLGTPARLRATTPEAASSSPLKDVLDSPTNMVKVLEAQLLAAHAKAAKRNQRQDKSNSSATTAAKKSTKVSKVASGAGAKSKAKAAGRDPLTNKINWKHPDWHHVTDDILSYIEERPHMKQAFGFDKGDTTNVSSGGKKVVDLHEEIGREILIKDSSGRWADTPLSTLREVVKNRINNLKGSYLQHRKKFRSTGEGVMTIEEENLKEKVITIFPWYDRLHQLMSASPLVMENVVSNSGSNIDMSVMDPAMSTQRNTSMESDLDVSVADSASEDSDNKNNNNCSHGISIASTDRRTSTQTKSTSSHSRKRKLDSISTSIHEASHANSEARMSVAKVMNEGKTAREQMRCHE